jgi:hypothetical protein
MAFFNYGEALTQYSDKSKLWLMQEKSRLDCGKNKLNQSAL